PRQLPRFPTRRSSDLADPAVLLHQKTPPPPAAAAIHGANVAATTGGLPDHPYPVAPAGVRLRHRNRPAPAGSPDNHPTAVRLVADRKSTRLNSSHVKI